ncbi:TIGR03032 family protein [Candidatus Sumerlaeota bacterium]|nr:TIGR03032 family protein [Candidatus Sumerlaeota bacterium]
MPSQPGQPGEPKQEPTLEISTSRNFVSWLHGQQIGLAFSTYQTGKLFLLGVQPPGKLSVFERTFSRAMGLHATRDEIHLSTVYQLWRFRNVLTGSEQYNGFDVCYTPRSCWVTGDIDIHDVSIDSEKNVVFVNTLFCCLAAPDENHSFRVIWKPPFISKLAPEDRCHLNGLAMKDGKPKYVTAVSRSDGADSWREHRSAGGIVMDVESDEIIATGFSMPHSPRWYNNRLWVLNSGRGEFGYVDLNSGRFEPITFCSGYARGLAFHGNHAIIGLSGPRKNKTFSGLPLDAALEKRNATSRCGILVVDLNNGNIVEWLRIEGIVSELYDVATLPGVVRPMAIGFKTDEVKRMLSYR